MCDFLKLIFEMFLMLIEKRLLDLLIWKVFGGFILGSEGSGLLIRVC